MTVGWVFQCDQCHISIVTARWTGVHSVDSIFIISIDNNLSITFICPTTFISDKFGLNIVIRLSNYSAALVEKGYSQHLSGHLAELIASI